MKLAELVFTGEELPDRDIRDLSWFDDGMPITNVEGDSYALYQKDQVFYLRDIASGSLAGWLELQDDTIKLIYVVPGFRQLGLSMVLINAAKERIGSLRITGAVFAGGERIIASMFAHPKNFRLSALVYGKKIPLKAFQKRILTKTDAELLIEGRIHIDGISGLSLPGVPNTVRDPLKRFAFTWFGGVLE
jgi:GNAT superfamily N-acetyltransferase